MYVQDSSLVCCPGQLLVSSERLGLGSCAITTLAVVFGTFGNGVNDVVNSYATSVAAHTLTMPEVGVDDTVPDRSSHGSRADELRLKGSEMETAVLHPHGLSLDVAMCWSDCRLVMFDGFRIVLISRVSQRGQ